METEVTILSIIKENIAAVTAILGALVSGFFTWIVSKHQYSLKKYEIEATVEFEARKMKYNSYKNKLEKYFKLIRDNSGALDKLYWTFALEGFDKCAREIKLFCDNAKENISTYSNPKLSLEEDIIHIETDKELKKDLDRVENIYYELTNQNRNVADYEKEFKLIKEYFSIMNMLEAAAIENQSDRLFDKYVKT